jgi:hypothetical protein
LAFAFTPPDGSHHQPPNHKAGIVIRAGGEIGFEVGQLLPLQFKLGLEGKGFDNTWPIGG